MSRRPLIGITMRVELERERYYLARDYSEAVEAAGGTPIHIPLIPNPEYITSIAEILDGVLLPGSDSDVDPYRYGHEPHRNLGPVYPLKDATDLLLLNEIERRRIPTLGICFGMQVLNVSRGGTLIQDINSEAPQAIKHEQGAPRDRWSHRIKLLEDSRLRQLAADDAALVNSHHHQAVLSVGRDLVATAWSSDGLIEAIEDPRPEHSVMAVQWHPEIAWARDPLSLAIFKEFVAIAGNFANSRVANSDAEVVRA
ncbi:MAG: gamma-glutamyl-gamma-aminobutyrate hydrolase family protein [Pyrinomonadaceae bacterium]